MLLLSCRRRNSICVLQGGTESSVDKRRHSICIPRYPVPRSQSGSPAGYRFPTNSTADPMASAAALANSSLFQSSLYAPSSDAPTTTHGAADFVFQSALYAPVTRISEETGMITTASASGYQSSLYAPAGASDAAAAAFASSLYAPAAPSAALAFQSSLYGAADSAGFSDLRNSTSPGTARNVARRNRTWNCPETTSSMTEDPVISAHPRRSISFNHSNATAANIAAAAAAAAAAAVAARNSMDLSTAAYGARASFDLSAVAAGGCIPSRVSMDLAAAAAAAASSSGSRPGTAQRRSIEINAAAAAAAAAAVAASRSTAAARASMDMSRPAAARGSLDLERRPSARASVDIDRRGAARASIDVERPPKAAGSDPVPVTQSTSGGVMGWAPKWAGTFWNPLAEVVKSGQIKNKGTGVFIPPGMKVEEDEQGAEQGEGEEGGAKSEVQE